MDNQRGSRLFVLLLAGAGLAALGLLSAALRNFTFQPVAPFSLNFLFGGAASLSQAGETQVIPVWKFVLFAAFLLTLVGAVLVLLDPVARKKLLMRLFRFAVTMAVVWYALKAAYERGNLKSILNMFSGAAAASSAGAEASFPQYAPPAINPWLIFAVSLAVGLGLTLLGWRLYRLRPGPRKPAALDEIGSIAREALRGLEPGGDWDETIVRAYLRMNDAVGLGRGLVRQPGVTPAEFAVQMERAGLPGEAARALTGLFEAVRYGGKKSTPAERDLAAAALSAIARACGVGL